MNEMGDQLSPGTLEEITVAFDLHGTINFEQFKEIVSVRHPSPDALPHCSAYQSTHAGSLALLRPQATPYIPHLCLSVGGILRAILLFLTISFVWPGRPTFAGRGAAATHQ